MIEIGDIVKFCEPNGFSSSDYCYNLSLTGRVCAFSANNDIILDFGLGYRIYSKPKFLEIISKRSDIPVPEYVGWI